MRAHTTWARQHVLLCARPTRGYCGCGLSGNHSNPVPMTLSGICVRRPRFVAHLNESLDVVALRYERDHNVFPTRRLRTCKGQLRELLRSIPGEPRRVLYRLRAYRTQKHQSSLFRYRVSEAPTLLKVCRWLCHVLRERPLSLF